MGEECKYHVPVVVEKFNVLDCSSLRFFKLKHGLSKCMKEIQGKLILVQVSMKLKLQARVKVPIT